MNVHQKTLDVGSAQQSLDLAVIGNGRTAALVNPMARIVWWCFPRFDGDPVFCRLLSGDEEKGFTDVVLDGFVSAHSEYLRNTADRHHGPDRQGRRVGPHHGFRAALPEFRAHLPPAADHAADRAAGGPAAHHDPLPPLRRARPRADAARVRQQPHPLHRRRPRDPPHHRRAALLCRPRGAVRADAAAVASCSAPTRRSRATSQTTPREFGDRTRDYWQEWIRRLAISYEWQDAVIRAAITLKLSSFEETGAIIAAHTTSVPEAPGSGRTWDYRFCWLRDAYFVVRSLNRIGATRTMEDYISYILTIVSGHTGELQPVYNIVSTDPLEERIVPDLKGYRGDGPVRIGNAAVAQNQHDTYGSAILAATPMFFDRRLPRMADENLFRRLEPLGEWCVKLAFVPDAGIWEYRGRKRIHTHSVSMCWAGCQRLEAIAAHLGLHDRAAYWGGHAEKILSEMLEKAWNPAARRLHGGVRLRRPRRQRAAAARARRDRGDRSAFRLHRQRDGAGTETRSSRYALQQC